MALARLGRLHRRLDLLSLGHSFEEPSSGLFPQLPALSADLAEPGRLLSTSDASLILCLRVAIITLCDDVRLVLVAPVMA